MHVASVLHVVASSGSQSEGTKHAKPSPTKPSSQSHENVPGRFSHVAFASHGSSSHSFSSVQVTPSPA